MMPTHVIVGLLFARAFFPAVAQEHADAAQILSKNHTDLVLPFIKEEHVDDTTEVTRQLTKLKTKAETVTKAKAATDPADTAADDCLLEENATLHAWKVCNQTRSTQKENMTTKCDIAAGYGVGTYKIDKSDSFGFDYTKASTGGPTATCNFETFTLVGADGDKDAACNMFVQDIIGMGKASFDDQFNTFTDATNVCTYTTDLYGNTTEDCYEKGKAHRAKEEECEFKDATKTSLLCKLQTAFKAKCTTLSLFNTALDEITEQEKARNKELRTVSLSKCLLDDYQKKDGECFSTSVTQACEGMVNGASEEYASAAAEQIHTFREGAKVHVQSYPCEEQTITIGVNDLSYEKLDSTDEFSYYTKKEAQTVSVDAKGVFSPLVCA